MTGSRQHGRGLLYAAAITFLIGLSGQPAKAAVATVGNCVSGGIHFATIQAAVTAVAAGSTIHVCPGNYPEQVVINKNLALQGVESDNTFNPTLVIPSAGFVANTSSLTSGAPLAGQIVVEAPATDVEISYLAVDGTGNNLNNGCSDTRLIGIIFQNASGNINYVVARNQSQNAANIGCNGSAGLGIFVQSAGPSTPADVTIRNSSVYGFQKNGITANELGATGYVFAKIPSWARDRSALARTEFRSRSVRPASWKIILSRASFSTAIPPAGTASGILIYDSGRHVDSPGTR